MHRDAPPHSSLLKLQRMEMALVRARMAHPDVLSEADYQGLRYALNFARLYRFAPGAALRRKWSSDVTVNQNIVEPFRELAIRALHHPLRHEKSTRRRLELCAPVLPALLGALREARQQLLSVAGYHDYGTEELDAEVSRKSLVVAFGGGGGAGYVYIGAAARLRAENMTSDYIAGASIGALIGSFLARSRKQDIEALLAWAKALRVPDIFARPYIGVTHTLPGLMRLHLRAMHKLMQHPDGSPLRLSDLEIPYEAVVAGIRTGIYDHMPAALRSMIFAQRAGKNFSARVAERMFQLTTFISPNVTQAIVLGRHAETRGMRVADTVGLSAAIPTVLQYEPPKRDEQSDGILAALRQSEQVALFVDGGVASNVPARILWEGVQSGRIGTRNAFHLALDCFQPQWDSHHLWLGPVQQLVQLQLQSQRNYFDWLVRFQPTLSPVNLLPRAAEFDQAYKWGWDQADVMMPFLKKALEPVQWKP